MRWIALAGYVALSLVFSTFYMRRMVPLRLVALCSNVAFLTYAFSLHLVADRHPSWRPDAGEDHQADRSAGEHTADLRGCDPRPGAANSGRYWPPRSGIA